MSSFLRSRLFVLILVLFPVSEVLHAADPRPGDLSANDLAEVLGVHWWIIELPNALGIHDQVGVAVFSSDGKQLEGGGGFSSSDPKYPIKGKIRVYCWQDEATKLMNVTIKDENGSMAGMHLKDYFKDSAIGGASNGSVLQVGDVLIKFDPRKQASFIGGNGVQDGQFYLKVIITHKS